MCRHLQGNQHYIDLYDLYTIKKCLNLYNFIQKSFKDKRNSAEFKNYTQEDFNKEVHKMASYIINIIKANRYRDKKETIQKWMARDKKEQDKFDNAIPPPKVLCKECFSETEIIFKDLHNIYEENRQVLFIFECPNCKKRQAQFEDGTEWHTEISKYAPS